MVTGSMLTSTVKKAISAMPPIGIAGPGSLSLKDRLRMNGQPWWKTFSPLVEHVEDVMESLPGHEPIDLRRLWNR